MIRSILKMCSILHVNHVADDIDEIEVNVVCDHNPQVFRYKIDDFEIYNKRKF